MFFDSIINILSLNAVVAQEVRNLAARSAEAAKQIKELVENAKEKADSGSIIARNMIDGYTNLNENIDSTTTLIELVTKNSKEQQDMINSVNYSIQEINTETKNNLKVAKETNIVAHQASDIAHIIVEDAKGKSFKGKDDIKVRKKIIDTNYKGIERRKIEDRIKKNDF